MDSINKKFWDQTKEHYSKVWEPLGRQAMSKKELNLISKIVKKNNPRRILDIGVGNGRILECLNKSSSSRSEIYGIDISKNMVNICKRKLIKFKKIKNISVLNLAEKGQDLKQNFDLITVIRVLKYNSNWPDMLKKITNHLNTGGLCVFTMPNRISISGLSGDRFSDKKLPIIYSSQSEIAKILKDLGIKKIKFIAFSKLPNFLYHISENKYYVERLLKSEKWLEAVLGGAFLGRELFVTYKK